MSPRKLSSPLASRHKQQRPKQSAASPIQVSTPPIRIVSSASRYQGGFRLDR